MSDTEAVAARRRRTGQFYTPPEVARFLVQLLGELAPGLRETPPVSVIDPACGSGTFLEAVVDVVEPSPARVVGVDLFPRDGELWDDAAEGHEQVVGDGLLDPRGEQFELVVGNPPYHGEGLRCLVQPEGDEGAARAERLARGLAEDFTLWRRSIRVEGEDHAGQLALLSSPEPRPLLSERVRDQLSRYPVELAFLDRFVQLCRPGGYVIIVLPEGVAANRSLQPVRDWITDRCQLLGVVGLPRGTFRRSGTTAATVTLLLRRREEDEEAADGQTLLMTVERLDRLDGLLEQLRDADDGRGAAP